jgi:hypothetical protein
MLGIPYRYEVVSDTKIKLAPTKGFIIANLVAPIVAVGVLAAVGSWVERKQIKESANDIKIDDPRITHPSTR